MKTICQPDFKQGCLSSVALVHVQFGATSKNCLHFGICRVEITKAIQTTGKPCQTVATLQRWEDKGLAFVWLRKEMMPGTIRRYFEGGVFPVEEAYTMPGEVSEVLGIQSFTIQPGIYPVLETEDCLKVIFT